VADWARKVLKFDDEDVAALTKLKLAGRHLLVYKSDDQLFSDFESIPKPTLRLLWAEIEKMKKAQAKSGM